MSFYEFIFENFYNIGLVCFVDTLKYDLGIITLFFIISTEYEKYIFDNYIPNKQTIPQNLYKFENFRFYNKKNPRRVGKYGRRIFFKMHIPKNDGKFSHKWSNK